MKSAIPQSIFWGLLPGFVTAFGGSYKDTLFEPFEPLKFFRSPIVCFLWYIVIDFFYKQDSVLLKIGFASMMERISVETYKAIYKPEPGKFKNCKCINDQCILEKDRGWILDRLQGK
jgi:hypothetical protein